MKIGAFQDGIITPLITQQWAVKWGQSCQAIVNIPYDSFQNPQGSAQKTTVNLCRSFFSDLLMPSEAVAFGE